MSLTEERRKKVMTGQLADDFLRLGGPPGPGVSGGPPMVPMQGQTVVVSPGLTSFVPPGTRGRLSVTIASARLARNYGLVRMDPYARLRVGNTIFETPTDVSGAKAPKWNRTVHCYLPEGVDMILVEIFDERAFTTDERIAFAHVPIPQAVFNAETIDDWYQMSGKEGEEKEGMINLVMSFAPLEAGPIQYVPVSGPPGAIAPQPMQQQPQPVQLPPAVDPSRDTLWTEEDVKELGEMFPAVDAEVIQSVLDEKRGNKEAAINALLSFTDD